MITKLPVDVAQHPLSPEPINPGLAPTMNEAPTSKPTDATEKVPRGLRIAK